MFVKYIFYVQVLLQSKNPKIFGNYLAQPDNYCIHASCKALFSKNPSSFDPYQGPLLYDHSMYFVLPDTSPCTSILFACLS